MIGTVLITQNVIKSGRLCSWCSDDFRQLDLHTNDSICWLLNFLALGYTVRVLQVLQMGRNLFAVSRTKGYKELCWETSREVRKLKFSLAIGLWLTLSKAESNNGQPEGSGCLKTSCKQGSHMYSLPPKNWNSFTRQWKNETGNSLNFKAYGLWNYLLF